MQSKISVDELDELDILVLQNVHFQWSVYNPYKNYLTLPIHARALSPSQNKSTDHFGKKNFLSVINEKIIR